MAQEAFQLPHQLTLNERKLLTMTGAAEVTGFDENTVVIQTDLGTLVVQGSGLHLKNLSPEGGQVTVEGTVSALFYEQTAGRRGSWKRRSP